MTHRPAIGILADGVAVAARAAGLAVDGVANVLCPASALRRHPRVRIVCDEAAAAPIGAGTA